MNPLSSVTLRIQANIVLRHADFALQAQLDLPSEGVTVLFGPSGSGKTSLLRCMAGLEPNAQGRIQVGGLVWQDTAAGLYIPPWQRPIGMVFQDASLFAHLTVAGNLDFGWKRIPQSQRRITRDQVIDLLGLGPLLGRLPQGLSGGEKQRVAIGRALLTSPQLLLLDEPLSALDAGRKQEILPYLETLRREWSIPMLYVTHAMEEVTRLADTLVLLDQGRVVGAGVPSGLLSSLDLPDVFADEASVLLPVVVAERDEADHLARLRFAGGELWVPSGRLQVGQSSRVRIHARDVSLALSPANDSSILNRLPATVLACQRASHPGHCIVQLQIGQEILVARITQRSYQVLALRPGLALWAHIKAVVLV